MIETVEPKPIPITDKIRQVGVDLASSFRTVIEALPGQPSRPSHLARELGLNRAISSKVLLAIGKQDPMEVTHVIPGPEPLRSLLQAAAGKDVHPAHLQRAQEAVRRFDALIRNDAGTRSALDAIISSSLPAAREKFELASKYSIFKGMSQLKGVQAETWLGTAIVTPAKDDPQRHDLTWLTGALSIQRLRADVTIRFSYRSLRDHGNGGEPHSPSAVPMEQFCIHPPAPLEAHPNGDVIDYTLPSHRIGPQHVSDMLVVDHHPAAMRRFAKPNLRRRNSLFVEPAFPVSLLLFDTILHKDAFPGSDPQLYIYDTGTKGIANVNDPTRDIDRMHMHEAVEFLGHDIRRFQWMEIPRYSEMLAHLAGHYGWDPQEYRGYRCRMQYPVYGWQIAMSFEPPLGD
jgi:hypothetical protein